MKNPMDRREFLKFAGIGAMFGGIIVLQGCGDSRSGGSSATTTTKPISTPTTTAAYSDKNGNIAGNHGHTVTLTAGQQQAGQSVTLTLTPATTDGWHTHLLSLTAAAVKDIAAGNQVTEESSATLGHAHPVTFN